jgi:hypothetical protein
VNLFAPTPVARVGTTRTREVVLYQDDVVVYRAYVASRTDSTAIRSVLRLTPKVEYNKVEVVK